MFLLTRNRRSIAEGSVPSLFAFFLKLTGFVPCLQKCRTFRHVGNPLNQPARRGYSLAQLPHRSFSFHLLGRSSLLATLVPSSKLAVIFVFHTKRLRYITLTSVERVALYD